MVHYQRYIQLRKGVSMAASYVDEEDACLNMSGCNKRSKPNLLFFLLFCTLLSACLLLAPFPTSTLSLLYPSGGEDERVSDSKTSLCSSVSNGTICCDRSSIRSDVCIMKGDIRTQSTSFSVFLYTNSGTGKHQFRQEKIKPYTRKWEPSTMATIDELTLISTNLNASDSATGNQRLNCDVNHGVPAVFFSTGGYTGNVYHEFNDGLIPLYITSQKYNKKVVFVILEYHEWWITKYGNILTHLSDFEPIDFNGDKRTHCFSDAIVGLRIHDELTVDSSLTEGSKTIKDFRDILDKGYRPRIQGLLLEEQSSNPIKLKPVATRVEKPKLVIISRNGSRAILNENVLVNMAEKIGFSVTVLQPQRTTELARIYRALNSSDVMLGVHGAAMTHFLFMKPGSVFIQVVPLGTNWAAETYYGEPAKKLGLRYIGYEILPRESSLYEEYESNDPVLRDPNSVNDRGWEFTKKIYLDRQKVRLNMVRFRKRLVRSYIYTMSKRNGMVRSQ
ncbi:hypothetical protein OSB04_024429 [Centaurea solstitialis]|uniref:Glycosyltransferase 61 catalytic domain-containing protein n=1 Tax=Centaurea solstitialis TaxID=347529 RepID=A0AA38T4K2_9ASTR|nr:hypothetical protein OSB04_024429 [Centaurea solstitialis]